MPIIKTRLTFLIRDFNIQNDQEIKFLFEEFNAEIKFFNDEKYSRFQITNVIDIANKLVFDSLISLSSGELPETLDTKNIQAFLDHGYIQQKDAGKYKINYYPIWDILNEDTKQFTEDIYNKLSKLGKQIIQVLFWRFGILGLANPLSIGPFEISIDDGKKWFEFHLPFRLSIDVGQGITFNTKITEEVKNIIRSQGDIFSIGFELWREAWHNRSINRRSSWLLGISALEASVVVYISKTVPKSEWLIADNQKPFLKRIYDEYFPKLVEIEGRIEFFPLKGDLGKRLQKAIYKRNYIAHTGDSIKPDDNLESTLKLCKDILYMTDYHFGNDWALDYITHETKDIYRIA